MGFRCDLNCPVNITVQFCCKNCNISKSHHVTDANTALWTEEYGFWSPTGCRLGRADMPEECVEYDCRKYVFTVERRWNGTKWEDLSSNAISEGYTLKGLIVEIGKKNGDCS